MSEKTSGYVTQLGDVPRVSHFAIIETGSIHVPGDERSHTNPGHGYPGHDVPTVLYQWFLNRGDWEREIARNAASVFAKRDIVALAVSPATITSTVQIKVEIL